MINRLHTLFCVKNDPYETSVWFVDLCGVGWNQQASFVRDILNTENWYIIYLLLIIGIQNKLHTRVYAMNVKKAHYC